MMQFNLARLLATVLMLAAFNSPVAAQNDATADRALLQAYPTSTTTVWELRERLQALEEEVRKADSAATEERKRLAERMDAIEENMPPRRLLLPIPPPDPEE